MGSVWIAGSYQSDYAELRAGGPGDLGYGRGPAAAHRLRPGHRRGGTEEDDAYLVTLTVDMNRDLSECVVFRASDVGRGPIARAQLPERIASGTHSCWAPGDSLRGWA